LEKIIWTMIKKISIIIEKIENSALQLKYYILSFFFIITFRNFLEIFSDRSRISYSYYLHYYLSYICLALIIILLFYLATRGNLKKIARVILLFFSIIIFAPVFDLIISLGKGYNITYLTPGQHGNLFYLFITFFGPIAKAGITIGMRIEIGLALIGSFLYFLIKTRSKIKSLFFTISLYAIIFFYCAMPHTIVPILKIFKISNLENFFITKAALDLMTYIYLIVIFFAGQLIFYFYNKEYYISIIKDMRFFRLIHFVSLAIIGLIIGKINIKEFNFYSPEVFFSLFCILISIIFAWGFSVMANNIIDQDIDKISNSNRPLIKKSIPLPTYKLISWGFFSASLAYSYIVNFKAFFFILTFIGLYYLYSTPPIRFKRVPYISKVIPALNSLIMLLIGYTFMNSGIGSFPGPLVLYFLIFITAAMNFIDIKDYEGDKRADIKTLPTILGLKRSKILIGLFFIAAYIAVYFFFSFPSYLLYIFIVLGAVQFLLINKKRYSETPIFIIYLFTLLLVIFNI